MIWGSEGAGTGPAQGAGSRIAIEAIGSAPRALPRRRRDPRARLIEPARRCSDEIRHLSVRDGTWVRLRVTSTQRRGQRTATIRSAWGTGTLWAYAPSLAKDEASCAMIGCSALV